MKKTLFTTICFIVALVAVGSPVKSMLAADAAKVQVGVLPYDAEVEYLEGDGSSAIETDIMWRLCDCYTEVDFTMPEVRDSVSKVILGSDGSSFNYVSARHRSRIDYFAFEADTSPNLPLVAGAYYEGAIWFEDGLYRFLLNGDEATYQATVYGYSLPLYLFVSSAKEDYTAMCFRGKIHGVRVWSDKYRTELLADLVPVRIGDDGYIYDRVGGWMYGNVGSGEFGIGPDVVE